MNAVTAHLDRLSAIRLRLENPTDFNWHAHGIGMLRTYLDDERMVRLNLWHHRLLNPGISTMHTHPRPFLSTIYGGMMFNKIYERVSQRPWAEPYREGIIHCGDAFNGIENDPPLVYLIHKETDDIGPGECYRLPPRVIHDTGFYDGTVTVMEWDRGEPDTCASVFWPDGEQWGDATRNLTWQDVRIVCAAALVSFNAVWAMNNAADMHNPTYSVRANKLIDWSKPLEPGPIKIDIPADERKLAEQDASAYGVGFLVDGKRVYPSRVVVLNVEKSGDTND